jgi:hypothetical protein
METQVPALSKHLQVLESESILILHEAAASSPSGRG